MPSTVAHTQPEAGPSIPRAPAQLSLSSRRASWDGEPTYGATPSILPDDFDIPSCLDRTSVFFQVLTAPYRPPTEIPPWHRSQPRPEDKARCSAMINWTSDHETNEKMSSDPCAASATNSQPASELDQPIYQPHGRWAWTRGFPIDNPKQLLSLRKGAQCSASIDTGSIADKEIKYICRRWKTSKQKEWYGFYSELALYKSERYLKPLQGDVVPHIIGVHLMPEAISVTMEIPHSSFWIESSPSMPDILKERVIAAFEKIHAQGVLHGDPELRHMLIGADGSVMIIDFGMSRAVREHESVDIERAEPEEFRLEMRKVKYKLDYMGARKKEGEKVDDYLRRVRKNRKTSDLWQRRAKGERVGPIPPYEEDPEEYKLEPPVNAQDFQEDWITASDDTPMRIVVPGQAPQALANEVQAFIRILGEMRSIPPSTTPFKPIPDDSMPPARLKRKLPAESSSASSPTKRCRPQPSPRVPSNARAHMWYSDDPEDPGNVSLPYSRNYAPLPAAASRIKDENLSRYRRYQSPHSRLNERGDIAPGHRLLGSRQRRHKIAALSGTLRRRGDEKMPPSTRYIENTVVPRDYLRQKYPRNAYIAMHVPNTSDEESRREGILRSSSRAVRGILKRRRDDDPLSAPNAPDLNDKATTASDVPSPCKRLRFSTRLASFSNSRGRAPSPELPIGRRPGDIVYPWPHKRPKVDRGRPEMVDFTLPSLRTLSTLVGSLLPWAH
ncbi:hypothetical protein BS17DRAFT_771541 [Gyrodon lividus]|nr:hypothetical protein BS17DRAFT_771541 [Gyrodon lividus]